MSNNSNRNILSFKARGKTRESIDRANSKLRFGIKILQGKQFKAPYSVVLAVIFDIKRCLELDGFFWQARILKAWINRFQGINDDYYSETKFLQSSNGSSDSIAEMEGHP